MAYESPKDPLHEGMQDIFDRPVNRAAMTGASVAGFGCLVSVGIMSAVQPNKVYREQVDQIDALKTKQKTIDAAEKILVKDGDTTGADILSQRSEEYSATIAMSEAHLPPNDELIEIGFFSTPIFAGLAVGALTYYVTKGRKL